MTDRPPRNEYPIREEHPPRTGYARNAYSATRSDPRRRAAAWYRVIALIWLIVAIIDVFIAARFILLLLGASQYSSFVDFVYAVAGPLVAPFEGIFGTPAAGAHAFEVADLVAIVVYTLLGAGLVALLRILSGRRQPDVPYDAP